MIETQALNEAQLESATFGLPTTKESNHPPLLIIAGAGTGKTNTLAHKTAQLILAGAAPERMLLMTFARRAASELASRANRIVDQTLTKQQKAYQPVKVDWMGTFHSISAKLLREYANNIGLDADFSIMDRGDSADMIDLLRHELGFSKTHKRFPKKKTCLDIYSRCVNSQLALKEVLDQHFPYCAAWCDELTTLFKSYAEEKLKQVCLDYDDLLLYCFHMSQVPQISEQVRAQFDYILVDEYQDTNNLQAGILTGFFPDGQGLTVVGDDAQSIYSFRSASVDNILNFPTLFSPNAKVVSLQKNYRSHQKILDLSNQLLSEGSEGYKVELHSEKKTGIAPKLVNVEDDSKQAEYIVNAVLASREQGVALKKQAVLFRSSYHSDRLELELTRRNIPYVKHGGLKFLEAAHVKDVLCMLRWADNPKHKISAYRVLKLLPGIGPKLAERIFENLAMNHFEFKKLADMSLNKEVKPAVIQLISLLDNIHQNTIDWASQMSKLSETYKPLLEDGYDDHFVRFGDIEQLIEISQQYPTRERFLTELTLDPPQSSGDLAGRPLIDDDYLILSTIHSAKGQEWQNVFVLNVADGNFPNEYACGDKRSIEEERRLLNVAITRAKNELHLMQPLKYWVPDQQSWGDKHVYGGKSRFLTDNVMSCIETTHYPKNQLTDVEAARNKEAITDIKKTILGQWQ